jgi:hypothetical protein
LDYFLGGTLPGTSGVWTGQYDNARTASNLNETILTQANAATTCSVVYVATMNNSVYAFEADNREKSAPLWQVNFGPPYRYRQVKLYIGSQIGILSIPVIDIPSNTMYVAALTVEFGLNVYRLHALDITSGPEKTNSPVVNQGNIPGTAFDARNGVLAFNPGNVLQRPALTLFNSTVVIAFGLWPKITLFTDGSCPTIRKACFRSAWYARRLTEVKEESGCPGAVLLPT